MKEVFKKSFNRESLEPFFLGVGTILLLEFVIFPGLTVANTFLNLLSSVVAVGLIIFTVTYLKTKIWDTKLTEKDSNDNKENKSNKENEN